LLDAGIDIESVAFRDNDGGEWRANAIEESVLSRITVHLVYNNLLDRSLGTLQFTWPCGFPPVRADEGANGVPDMMSIRVNTRLAKCLR